MPQQTRTTNELIVDSLHLIGELPVGYPPDGFMLSKGLDLLNEIINTWTSSGIFIPYLERLNFTTVAGQDTYSISDLLIGATVTNERIIDLVFCNYTVPAENDEVSYVVKIVSKGQYFGNRRLTTLNSRPAIVFLNKQYSASFITFYPVPDQPYNITIHVKSMLDRLNENESVDEVPPYYYRVLKYALAREFLMYYPSGNWTPQAENDYQDALSYMKNSNEMDLTIQPSTALYRTNTYYWTDILAR